MLNKAMLIGNLGNDPELRYTPTGQKYCKFSLATTKRWKKDGEAKETTTWHNIIAWGGLAEICAEYLQKGKQVYIEGEIQQEVWEKDGVKYHRTVINAHTMKMLGRKENGGDHVQTAAGDDFPF